jgi:hypothetical protein
MLARVKPDVRAARAARFPALVIWMKAPQTDMAHSENERSLIDCIRRTSASADFISACSSGVISPRSSAVI